jgi:hypothetical protein
MTSRRDFLASLSAIPLIKWQGRLLPQPELPLSDFAKKLEPLGRRLEMEGYYVWCCAPILAPDGKLHVFFSRWKEEYKMGGWIHKSEIAHAVANSPEAPLIYVDTILAPRGANHWDATTCHNPHIQYIDGQYCLFYMGNANGKTDTKRIGLATAPSLDGPWTRPDKPLLEAGTIGSWDDHCTTNPSFVKHPNGEYWLYYKSWNTSEYAAAQGAIRGNRKYGLAIAQQLHGPYIRFEGNPIVDFSGMGQNQQVEDAFTFRRGKHFYMITRDMGYFNHEVGLWMDSKNGKNWNKPQVAYLPASSYISEPPPPAHLKRYGRFERPQILMQNDRPAYLFTAMQGGQYGTASGFLFKIKA